MTTDLRHLLTIYVHAHRTGNSVPPHIDAEARAALAEEPAGREPVAVIGELSDKRPTVMEIVELSSEIEAAGLGQVDFARAVLARWGKPTPVPPADGEVAELEAWLRETGDLACQADAEEGQRYWSAADLLQQRHPITLPPELEQQP